ncbi:Protein of unknown function (DUF2993) [Chthonomonas calidirosea]|uniref:DUF2993 domain-containing protein n=1 Tax=Chthonomonas calidirosea (strain DSM 23976 / ICMP 18418 / T49) TaxID=1303518 RepID=S0EV87_CHTCT|nr:DUF2993 domain-containing protein [Chthonomonas calidirosea]CCW35680.1 Protein of unknown function (DUF2993) [Chthonomonas calidirosea T49]CEK19550.1 Protein of unknown function (DUF2993) [Chthonomonas calidirosea]
MAHRKVLRWIGLGTLLVALLFVNGCTRPINRTAERRIREALPSLLGPAKAYRVHVESSPLNTLSGRLAHVLIDADDLQLPNGLLLQHLHLDLKGVDFDTQHKQLRHIDSAHFQAVVDENALTLYLIGQETEELNLRDLQVHILPNNILQIAGERTVLGVGVPFSISGPIRLMGPDRIELDPDRLTLVGIHVPDLLFGFIKSRFESAITFSNLPFPIRLTSLHTQSGQLFLEGDADVGKMADAVNRRVQEASQGVVYSN